MAIKVVKYDFKRTFTGIWDHVSFCPMALIECVFIKRQERTKSIHKMLLEVIR